jgi:hypothetical protein
MLICINKALRMYWYIMEFSGYAVMKDEMQCAGCVFQGLCLLSTNFVFMPVSASSHGDITIIIFPEYPRHGCITVSGVAEVPLPTFTSS